MAESEYSNSEQTESIDLVRYWNLLWRYKLLIIACGLLFSVPVVYIEKNKPNTYESTASLSIQQDQRSNIMDIEGLYGVNTQSRTYARTQFEILGSRQLAERVINNLDLLNNPDFIPQRTAAGTAQPSVANSFSGLISNSFPSSEEAAGPEEAIETGFEAAEFGQLSALSGALVRFSRSLRIQLIPNSSIVEITYTSTNPKLAATIANEVATAYIQQDMEQRLSATQQASRWLTQRVADLGEELQESEARLQAFLEREQLIDSGEAGGVTGQITQQIDLLTSQMAEAQRKTREMEAIYRQIEGTESPTALELLAIPAIANHGSLQQAKQNFEEINQQITELGRRYGRNHPQMIALQAEFDSAQSNLIRLIQQVSRNEYQLAVNNQRSIQQQLTETRAELQGINSKGFELQELRREVETNRQLYEMFFTRIRETQETDDLLTSNAVLVDPAVPALYPTGPNRKRNVLIALMAGLMFGTGLILAKDMLNNTVKSHIDIETRLHSNILGVIPKIKKKKAKGGKEKDRENNFGAQLERQSLFFESFRTIRTSLDLASLDNPYKVITVTSSLPGEGKTTVALNLASALAQMGRSVLLIDGDLRRPSLDKLVKLAPDAPGLYNYLSGKNELQQCLHNQEDSRLIIMPAGSSISDPLELLSSGKFKRFLANFGTKCDHIILDTPPTQAVSDSLILANIADATIFVVKASSTPTRLAKTQLARLKRSGANIAGVVLNQLAHIEKNNDYVGYYDSYAYTGYAKKD